MTPCLPYLVHRSPSALPPLIGGPSIGRLSVRDVPVPQAEFQLRSLRPFVEMPVSKSTTKPIRNPHQVNGFYVHSSPPKVLQVHSSVVRQWLRAGDLDRLEQLVLEGQGHKLVGEYSPDPRVRGFLKQIPAFLVKTRRLNDAVARGDLKSVQKLFNSIKSPEPPLKNIHMSKSHGGLGLLHKAVYYGHPHIVEFLVSNFPESVKMKDNEGKIPIHYCGASKDAGKIWPMLMKAGSDPTAADSSGRLPVYYMERSNEIQLPDEKLQSGFSLTSTGDRSNLVIKPSNIRIWIHDRDLRKLQRVIWEGHGAKLRVETSKHPKVKRFLEGVPYVLNFIKDVHSAVINDDLNEFRKKTSDPTPPEILGSKDVNGLTPLHKAAGLNRKKMAEEILKRNPSLVFSVDEEGKTPLHYAAVLKVPNESYALLTENHADESAEDKSGKTPAHYKANPKELKSKLLEVIPEAPRTSATFPPTFDWSLFRSDNVPSANGSIQIANAPPAKSKARNSDEAKPRGEDESEGKARADENPGPKESESEDKSSVTGSESAIQEGGEQETPDSEESKNVDIWTNEEGERREENTPQGDVDSLEEKEEESPSREERKEEKKGEGHPPGPDNEDIFKPQDARQKTEREIAEERQRLLDEGLLKVARDEEEGEEEGEEGEGKLKEAIELGDMEKLAAMVLNGEGHRMQGRSSNNPEVQSFLENIPAYMAKITAVHKAAREGSLKDLQAALDRRKFAIAKESTDESGATPLHVAVIFKNSPIIQYLGGRFPETLLSKDKFGRTPLHYAAALQDDHRIYASLLDLGADLNVEDDEGRTPTFYLENPGHLTREALLEKMNLPPRDSNTKGVSSPVTDPSIHDMEPEISFDEGIPLSKAGGDEEEGGETNDDGLQSNFNLTDRDEYGQSVLHFAAARAHGRGGLFQLIHESGVNLGFRDELYRTARDIAQQANIPENVNEVDKYVISLAAKGETGKLMELFLEGYDHILDLEDDEDNDILTIVTSKNHHKTLAFLKAIPILEEKREKIHRAVRAGDLKSVESTMAESKNARFLMAGKNTSGRCSLHIAVLCQRKEVTELVAQKFPETLKIGDNLERTPLHYAMGVEEVEALSKILIKCGAKRVVKDLKGRQPTYYFMNRTEILKLQEEENVLRA